MTCARHPRDSRMYVTTVVDERGAGYVCLKCGTHVSQAKSVRGKRANRAGRTQSREIASEMDGTNMEQYGEKYDVLTDLFAVQSKRGATFPERIWKWLDEIPRIDGRIPVLVMRDAPGPGTKRRGVAIVVYEDWLDLHGGGE